jgi:HD-GYP domain-containing protein (c-di-GMP phosphodiesterase class II)
MIEITDMSQIHRYFRVPLYLKTSTDNFVLYKKEGEIIDTERRYIENFPAALYIDDKDQDDAVRDVNKSIHKELIKAIETGDIKASKELLIEAVEHIFRNPRSKVLIEIADELVKAINMLDLASLKQFLKISIADYTTASHSVCVSAFAVNFSKKQNWSWERTQVLTFSAMLHDIGRTKIPDSILFKQSPLTDDEFKTMQSHTIAGGQILAAHTFPSDTLKNAAISAAIYHHQKLDGSGYPYQEKMMLSYPVQVLGMLDAYESLTSDERPYRKPLPAGEALKILKNDTLQGKYGQGVFTNVVNSIRG